MKRCTFCGREYPDNATMCAADGYALRDLSVPQAVPAPFPIIDRQQIVDAEQIKMLAIFHFVLAGLALVGLGFLCLHFLVISAVISIADSSKASRNGQLPTQALIPILTAFYFFLGSMLAAAGALNFFSGLFLRQRKHRIFSMIVGGLNCLQIPFGTILGIFTIMALSRTSVRASYPDE